MMAKTSPKRLSAAIPFLLLKAYKCLYTYCRRNIEAMISLLQL